METLGLREDPKRWGEAAKRLGISPQLLRDRMRITRLASAVRQEFESGDLDLSAAQALGRLDDQVRQVEAAKFIEKNQLNTRFVGTKFIKELVSNPEKPIAEVYTIALSEQRAATSVSGTAGKPKGLADQLEELLADFRRSENWLEAAGREELLAVLEDRGDIFNSDRLLKAVGRLGAMCNGFLMAKAPEAGNQHSPMELPSRSD